MKHVVFLGDGMADEPFAPLGGHTPLELARHPGMDFLASQGEFGLTRTVPSGMPAGSDTANLSVFGYDPKIYYSGRSPLEAASMGIPLAPEDVTYRCNLVTLSDADNIENAVMIDYSADDISNEEAHELIAAIAPLYAAAGCELHAGFRYRHCLVLRAAASGTPIVWIASSSASLSRAPIMHATVSTRVGSSCASCLTVTKCTSMTGA